MIEEEAEWKEKEARANGTDANEVNDMLIDAIEAKLAILDDLN